MKVVQAIIGIVVALAVVGGVLVLTLRPEWVKPHAQSDEDKPVETDVAVKTATVTRATLRRYVEGYGAVEPEPAMDGKPAAGAAIASPISGMVAEVLCEPGKLVKKDAVLIQLDDRLAKAQEDQAQAALESATATLARVKATPRPEQLEIAQLAVDKSKGAVDLAQKNFDRQQKLGDQVASTKTLQIAETELNAARVDLQSAQKQWALLKASPSPEELAEATAKMHEARQAVAVAQTQRSLLKILAPMTATVLRVAVNKGEAVDPTKVIVELASLDRLTINATISARELTWLKLGQSAEIRMTESAAGKGDELAEAPATKPADSAATQPTTAPTTHPAAAAATAPSAGDDPNVIRGTVKMIGFQVDRKTDTVQVWVSVPADARLRPGQYARVRIITDEHRDRLSVPVESVVADEDGKSVIVLVNGDNAVQTPVQLGLRDRNVVEVEAENLKEGDTVVTEGAYGLPKKTKVHKMGG